MGKRAWGAFFACTVTVAVLSGCATGNANSPSTAGTSTSAGTGTSVGSSITAEAVQQSTAGEVTAAQSSADSAEEVTEAQDSADSAEEVTEAQDSGESAEEVTATQDLPASAEEEALAHGWYDERGWVSPETAARAMAAGIAPGANVPDDLRCGTRCGEDPTSGEMQAQKSAEAQSSREQATGTSASCAYMVVRGVCYTTPEEAKAAGE